jgi:hypothetical protein
MNKLSSPNAEVKQQHTLVELKAGCDNDVADPFISCLNLRFNGTFEI